VNGTTALIEGNTFEWNIGSDGGAVLCDNASPLILGNTFTGNISGGGGGAIECRNGGNPVVQGNAFVANRSFSGGALASLLGGHPVIDSNTFDGNVCYDMGATLYMAGDGSSAITNNIITGSVGGEAITIYDVSSLPSVLSCNDVWNNASGNYGGVLTDPTGTDGNISVDPLYCDAPGGDYTLTVGSPCLAGNHPDGADCGLIGALPAGCGPTGVRGQADRVTWGSIKGAYR